MPRKAKSVKELPILEARHLHKPGSRRKPNGAKSFSDWFYKTFGFGTVESQQAHEHLAKLIKSHGFEWLGDFEKSPLVTLETQAKTWNQLAAAMGYTEGNPEA